MKKAFVYLRVSSKGQAKSGKDGFPRQLREIELFAKEHGFEIVRVFKEHYTGTEAERPAFVEMLSEILGNGVDIVIIQRLSRLARAFRIQEELALHLASKGIQLYTADTGENITAAILGDPMKLALVQMRGVFSELEKNLVVHRLKSARNRLSKDRGQRIEGRKSYGATEEEQHVIRRMRAMRRTRKGGHKGMTYEGIAERLNSEGIKTKDGREWSPARVYQILNRK